MSAPLIPNLTSLRKGGLRGRGRVGSSGVEAGGDLETHRKPINHDDIVQTTDNDAATSRQSAIDAGYLEDPFSTLLHMGGPVARRLPLMNRGRRGVHNGRFSSQFTIARYLRENNLHRSHC